MLPANFSLVAEESLSMEPCGVAGGSSVTLPCSGSAGCQERLEGLAS